MGIYHGIIRMVRWFLGTSMKRSFKSDHFRSSLNYEELLTVVIETYIYPDVEESLFPGQLLIGERLLNENTQNFDDTSDKVEITKRAQYPKTNTEHYWTRWKNGYLVELSNTHTQNEQNTEFIEVGEVVCTGKN